MYGQYVREEERGRRRERLRKGGKKGRSEEERMGKHEREGVGSRFDSRCC